MQTKTTKPSPKKNKKASNYIDNEKMYQEMVKYKNEIAEYNKLISKIKDDQDKPKRPRISEYIGSCIIMIAQRLATKPNFANYVHRDEMIGDGIENCLMYIDNFDPNKSKNPFAYFTQIIYFAFVRRIQKEKKQMYVKMRMLERMDKKGTIHNIIRENPEVNIKSDNIYADYFNLKDSDIKMFDKSKKKNNKKNKKSNLDDFFQI